MCVYVCICVCGVNVCLCVWCVHVSVSLHNTRCKSCIQSASYCAAAKINPAEFYILRFLKHSHFVYPPLQLDVTEGYKVHNFELRNSNLIFIF